MKKILFLTIICFLTSSRLHSQNYFDSINRVDSLNFFEKDSIIDTLYSTLPDSIKYAKESGYKDYERWKYFMYSRVDSTGHLDSFMTTFLNVQKDLSGSSSKTGDEIEWCGSSFIGDWKPLGFSKKPSDNSFVSRNGLGWMRTVWTDPSNTNIMLAGANMGGLWKTTDGGNNWSPISTGLFDGMGIGVIAVNPLDHDVIYVAPSYNVRLVGAGIWKTVNGGQNWYPVFMNNTTDIYDIAIHPFDTSIVYAIIGNRVFRSKDGGNTKFENDEAWGIRTSYNPTNTNSETEDIANQSSYGWVDIEFEITGMSSVRVHIVGSRFHMVSDDDGDTYFGGQSNNETAFAYSNLSPSNYVYDCQIAISGNIKYRGYVAVLQNKLIIEKWNSVLNIWQVRYTIDNFTGVYSGGYHMGGRQKAVFEVSSLNPNIIYIGGVKFYIYDDVTQSLSGPYSNIHDDMRGISVVNISGSSELIVVANDGGIKKAIVNSSSPLSITWEDISYGLQVQQIHGLSINNELPAKVYTGHQDIGIVDFNGNDKSWSQSNLSAGDGGEVLVNPDDPSEFIWMLGGPPAFITSTQAISLLNPELYHAQFVYNKNKNLFYGGKDGNSFKLVKYHDPFSSAYNQTTDRTIFSYPFPGSFSALYVSPDEQLIFVAIETGPNVAANLKFFRSIDGGTTWENASQFIHPNNWGAMNFMLRNSYITDIVGNPNDNNELYISFGFVPTGAQINWRVAKSSNAAGTALSVGFATWSEGLIEDNVQGISSLPVSKLIYDELSSNHMVYAATDMGVYYRNDDTDDEWVRFSEGLPYAISTDLILDRKEHRLILATYGLGTWYTDIPCCNEFNVAEPLETNTTWNTEMVINNIIIVPNGVTLRLEDATFWFKPNSQIIIQAGGKLEVNNALLTSFCNSFWGGIVVEGIANSTSVYPIQGFLEITNSTVQYAYRGVFCGDLNDFSKGGGIIHAENTTFKDCRVGVAFFPYPSFGGYLSTSKIRNSKFLWTGALPDPNATGFGMLHGISLWQINGVRLEGNQYINLAPETFNDEPVYSDGFRGNGIYALDASFLVDRRTAAGIHCQEPTTMDSYFNGLSNGVIFSNSSNLNNRNGVINTIFKNCQNGIIAIDDDYSKFYGNTFEWDEKFIEDAGSANGFSYGITGGSPVGTEFVIGIYHNGSDGFLTEGNTANFSANIDRTLNYNPFMFREVKGSNADYAVRNSIINNIDPGAIPKPLIIGKSLVDDCANLTLGCNEYCDLPVDWYFINNTPFKLSHQAATNNFTDPNSSFSVFNVNYNLTTGSGTKNVIFNTTGFSVTSNCSYTLPSSIMSYKFSSTISPQPTLSPACGYMQTSLCAAYKQTQVLPGDQYDGSFDPSVDRRGITPDETTEKKNEVVSLINNRSYTKAKIKLEEIPGNTDENVDFKTYYTILISEFERGNNLHTLSSQAIDTLKELSKQPTVHGSKGRTLLLGFYGIVVKQQFSEENPEANKNADNQFDRYKFKVYPNPAGNYINLSYELKEQNLPAKVEIVNSLGVTLYSSTVTNLKGTITLITDSWSDGVYLVNIKGGQSVLFTEKVVLIH